MSPRVTSISVVSLALTVTLIVLVVLPSFDLTVIVALPGLLAIIAPLASTLTILGLLLSHNISLLVALSGTIV